MEQVESTARDKRKMLIKVSCIILASVVIFQVIEWLRPSIPENVYQSEEIVIKWPGLLILGVYYLMIQLLVMLFETLEPKLSDLKMTLAIGACVFITEFVFKVFQIGNDIRVDFLKNMGRILLVSVVLMAIANLRIHKTRKKKIALPFILAAGVSWLCFFIYKHYFLHA